MQAFMTCTRSIDFFILQTCPAVMTISPVASSRLSAMMLPLQKYRDSLRTMSCTYHETNVVTFHHKMQNSKRLFVREYQHKASLSEEEFPYQVFEMLQLSINHTPPLVLKIMHKLIRAAILICGKIWRKKNLRSKKRPKLSNISKAQQKCNLEHARQLKERNENGNI